MGRDVRVHGTVWVHGSGAVVVGDRVVLDAAEAPIELHAHSGATIAIGDDTTLAGGVSVDATSSIAIGARCRVGAYCKLMDNHFHPLRGDRQARPSATEVVVEDDAELGRCAILLPGAHVDRGVRLAPRALIRRRVASTYRPHRTAAPLVDVSVVVPTFGRTERLLEAVRSALAQEGVAVEVMVVDGSPDRSALQPIAGLGDGRVTYVAPETPSGRRTRLVRDGGRPRVRGRHVHFLDADADALPGSYAALVAALDAHPLCAMSFGVAEPSGDEGPGLDRERALRRTIAWGARFASRLGRYGVVTVLSKLSPFHGSACMVRRSVLEEAGGFDPAGGATEDTGSYVRGLRRRGCVFVDLPVVRRRLVRDREAAGQCRDAHRGDWRLP